MGTEQIGMLKISNDAILNRKDNEQKRSRIFWNMLNILKAEKFNFRPKLPILKVIGSGALYCKMLHVRIIANNESIAYSKSGQVK